MKQGQFNNLINFEYRDDYVELTPEENEKYFSGDLMRLSVQNKAKHILLSISKTRSTFINRFVSLASVLVGTVNNLEQSLKDYKHIDEYESVIMNTNAITECFEYFTHDFNNRQYGELSIFKVKKAFYIIYCICRYEDKEECKTIFKEFKDSFK